MLFIRFCVYVTISLNRNAQAPYATSAPRVLPRFLSTILTGCWLVIADEPDTVDMRFEREEKAEEDDEAAAALERLDGAFVADGEGDDVL